MVPYPAAGPDSAFVLPSRMELLVMPTSVATVGLLEPPHAARVTRNAAIAAMRDPVFAIELPPTFMNIYLNSLYCDANVRAFYCEIHSASIIKQSGDPAESVQSPDRRAHADVCGRGRSRW